MLVILNHVKAHLAVAMANVDCALRHHSEKKVRTDSGQVHVSGV